MDPVYSLGGGFVFVILNSFIQILVKFSQLAANPLYQLVLYCLIVPQIFSMPPAADVAKLKIRTIVALETDSPVRLK